VSRRLLLLAGLPLALGCGDHWRAVDAVRPGLAAMDVDGDGRLDAAELERGAPVPVDLASVDRDHSQSLDAEELLALLRTVDPGHFDDGGATTDPSREDVLDLSPDPRPVRTLRVLFEFMVAEIQRVAPRLAVPSHDRIDAAARTGTIDSPECRALVAELAQLYRQLDLVLPPSLRGLETAASP
jgi:hypothetical protein